MRLGIMGGTFNPPHLGHLEAARHACEQLELDKVLFVPANIPPHKTMPNGSATAAQRCHMVQLMLQDEPWAQLSKIEISRCGTSYTIDTLHALKAQYPDAQLTLIVGTDMLESLAQWRQPQQICQLAMLAVVARSPGDDEKITRAAQALQEQFGAQIRQIHCPAIDVSSTAVRNGNIRDAIPAAVAQYITQNKLYH